MIILKNTKNTQTFYVSKKCGIETAQLPVGSYTKIEADARFQPKGNYISEDKAVEIIDEQINSQLDVILEPKLEPIKNDITELETSKMEVFQVNSPMSFNREGEDLHLSIDLSNYALKADIPSTEDFATKEELTAVENKIPDVSGLATKDEVALKADKSELSSYVTTDAYNTKMTELDGEISAIQAQIGNISTTLDTINGEIPNE
jgi:hypothetical protein